ncbi:hypothetical protein [Kitasatospora sp. LaBMicrA B282]|uniref:hypothetical protein n=1 Tax=Kitasatospora sp. LaBMicrA B282 TaxID=3420949 RepID=UPI003D0C313D
MGGKSPSALPSFATDWIGGDIHGLSALAGTLYGYQPQIEEASTFLDNSVNKIAHDAGWSGDAASAFKQAWETDSMAATALAGIISSTGDIVDTLAVDLATIESALEAAADQARKAGVPIGDDGKPPAPAAGPPPQPGSQAAATAGTAGEYATLWTQSFQMAEQARLDAATRLQQIYLQIAPPGAAGAPALNTGDKVTVGDYLRGLWAVPSAYSKTVDEQAEQAEKDAATAKDAWTKAKNARPNPSVPMPQDVKDALHDSRAKLAGLEGKLTSAEGVEARTPLAKALDVRVSAFFSGVAAEAGTSEELSLLRKTVRFAGDIPVLDVLAAGAGTYFGAEDDIEKGMPWYEAVPENALSNVGSLAVGAAAGTAVYGVVAGLGFAGATVGGVVAGAAVGGVVAVGVGDLASDLFHEHWDEDMKKDGFWGGLGDGIGHSVSNTGSDLKHMGEKIWNSIF